MIDQRTVKIKGYNIYFTNHPDGTSHAGAAIIIKENIKQHVLPNFRHEYLQAAIISIDDWQGTLNLAAVYCPPRHRICEKMFSEFFQTLGTKYIAGGDWNAKNTSWGSRLTTTRGRELKKAVDLHHLSVLSTGEPTHWPTDCNKSPDLIDFFISKGMSGVYTKIESCLDGSSDHTPVICTLSTTVILKEPRETIYNWKTDWEAFRTYIEEKVNLRLPLKTEEDVDNAVWYTTNFIQESAWLSTPYIQPKHQSRDYSIAIRNKITEKRRLRRKWHTSRNGHDKRLLNKAQKELKTMLDENETITLQDQLKTLSPHKTEDYSLYKITKTLKRTKEHIPPLKKTDGNWTKSPKEKAELFGQYLQSVFKPNEPDGSHPEDEIDKVVESTQEMSTSMQPVTPREVCRHIKYLKLKKAPGYDLITAEVLKQLPRKGIVLITIVFNAMIRLQYFPHLWKVSIINMIPKPGKPPTDVSSYRPISLLPLLSKLFEKIVLNRILPFLEEKKVIPDHQFGFRAEHGTTEQIHRVAHTIRQTLERKEYCSAVFLDIQQAFDRVWHKGLLYKLKLCIPNAAYMLIKSYLSHRSFQVKCDNSLSTFYNIEAGVPQGSVLGPVLYTVYTSDLPISEDVITATYADDTAILSSNNDADIASFKLQDHLDKINIWLKKWRIKASAVKSNHITFTLKKGECPPVKLDENILPHKTTVKYLGIHLDRRLTWRDHIKAKRDQCNWKFRELYWLIGRKSSLSFENKLLIYKSIIKPVWTYGIQLWGSASHSNIEILQRFQNNVLKVLCNAPWYTKNSEVHEYSNIPTVKEEIKRSIEAYKQRLECHKNTLALKLLDSSDITSRLKRARLANIE